MKQGVESTEQTKQKINAMMNRIHSGQTQLNLFTDENSKICYIQALALGAGVTINERQIQTILRNNQATIDEVMRLQTKPSNPKVALAIQIALATAVALWKPGIAGSVLANIAARQTLHALLDPSLGIYKDGVDAALVILDLALDQCLGLGDYTLRSLGSEAMRHIVNQYGSVGYLAIPAGMVIYNQKANLYQASVDFTEMMYGTAEDETYEKYSGNSLATMTIDDVSASLSWLWSKVPSLRKSPAVEEDFPFAHSSETARQQI
jgi:hypothetical protein